MARKGQLAEGVKLEPFLSIKKGKSTIVTDKPRCQFVKAPKEGERYGSQCKNPCINGRPRCKYHGGLAGRKPVTGEFSKYAPIPRGLVAKFEETVRDPQLLDLTKNIALLNAQIWKVAEDASKQNDFTDDQRRKLIALIREHKELVKHETERRLALRSFVDISQLLLIINYISQSVNKHVKDPTTRGLISSDIRKLTAGQQRELALPGSSKALTVIENEKDE